MKYEIRRDRFAKARDGSRFLDIYCAKCGSHLCLYQKDGLGGLVRLYLDRIREPQPLAALYLQGHTKQSLPDLKCKQCQQLIATPMLYESENRLAMRLIRGTYQKKKSDGTSSSNP